MVAIPREENRNVALFGVSSADGETPIAFRGNPSTGALLIDSTSIYVDLDARYLKLDASNDPVTGDLLLQPSGNSTQVFQVKNAEATRTLLTADTFNFQVYVDLFPVDFVDVNIPFLVVGNNNNYYGINVGNVNSSGIYASTDVVALNAKGEGTTSGFVDFGINGVGWADPDFAVFDAGAGYVFNVNSHFYVGAGVTGNLYFFTGGVNDKGFIRGSVSSAGVWTISNLNGVIKGTLGVLSAGTVSLTSEVSGVLPVANGGTNISSYAIGDILYASGSTTLSKLADVATGNALISGGITTAPSWGKIALTTHISGILPVANGGTNISSYAVGDLIYASTTGVLSKLADVAVGSYLRSGGVNTAPLWSTLILPNAGTVGDIPFVSSTNTITMLADVAAGSFLRSGGVTTAPVWSTLTIPNSSSQGDIFISTASNVMTVLAKNTTATRYLANTGTTNNPAWAQITLTNGVTGVLPIANGGTNSSSQTTNGVAVFSGSAITTGSTLTFASGVLTVNTNLVLTGTAATINSLNANGLLLTSSAGAYGLVTLTICNLDGANGAVFTQSNNTGAELVDFLFRAFDETDHVTVVQRNIRYENRAGSTFTGVAPEWQIGYPGSPEFVISALRTQVRNDFYAQANFSVGDTAPGSYGQFSYYVQTDTLLSAAGVQYIGDYFGDVSNVLLTINSTTNSIRAQGGSFKVSTGSYSDLAAVGGVIYDHYADQGNTTTSETDLYTDTTVAGLLAVNGQKITASYAGIFVSSATATRRLKVYFAGTLIYDSSALSISTSAEWNVRVLIIRESSSVVRCVVTTNTTTASAAPYCTYTRITGLTLSGTNILKITGTAAGVGAATNDIVAKLGTVSWEPAA